MARVKYGAIITEIKGKIGGTIFQGGRSGGIIKNKPAAKCRKSLCDWIGGNLSQVRTNNLGIIAKEWASLSNAERNSWGGLLGVWLFTDRFGNIYDGTPYQIYTAVNINRTLIELPRLASAPIKINADDLGLTVLDYSLAGSWDIINVNASTVQQKVVALLSTPQAPTKNFGSVTVSIQLVMDAQNPTTTNGKPVYQAFYGGDPPLGSIFYLVLWTTVPAYPRKQFYEVFRVNVVA